MTWVSQVTSGTTTWSPLPGALGSRPGLRTLLLSPPDVRVLSPLQFPARSNAASDEQKVFGLWENGDGFDKVNVPFPSVLKRTTRVAKGWIWARPRCLCGPAAASAALRALHQALPAQEGGGPGPPGSGVGGGVQSRSGPAPSRENRAQRVCSCQCGFVTPPVAAGVLQQPRGDVVPEGDHTVLTVTTPPPPPPPPPRCPVGGVRQT